ncbi:MULTISPECIES: DUF3558 domain-containing protein [unclassified Streptomyces]|uniref:DUF3558 domain-containing protein n=1 Tax=unclassified Streptomyces TaxID=2593676 RepID=UPI002E2057F4|nr:DUF3558 domain-containing protein [Streptomyces sp. NBC_01023]
MHRSAPRLTRLLACAAVPVMLVVAGCSSDSGSSGKKNSSSSPAPSASASPTVAKAVYAKLPDACKSIPAKTVSDLVPKAKDKSGTEVKSTDLSARAGCSWNGLESKGTKGSQYRWLSVSYLRFDSDSVLGSGQKRAQDQYAKAVADVKATDGAKNVKTVTTPGIGDEATTVTYEQRKTDADFIYAVVVTRSQNVITTVNQNGAGYEGLKSPSADDMSKGAQTAAKAAVASVASANK